MMSLSDDTQADMIEAFNSTFRHLDGLLNIDNPYFERMITQIYPTELPLNKAKSTHTEALFLDLHLSISNDFVSSKIYDKLDEFDLTLLILTSHGVNIFQLRFVSSHLADFNSRNKALTAKFL